MPVVFPFQGLRYSPEAVGSLADVLVPPYDALTDDLAAEVRARSPWNLIHVEVPAPDGAGDAEAHRQAGKRLRRWIRQGVLAWDREPAFYVYRHRFVHDGTWHTRVGLVGLAQLHDWRERVICPHERTQPAEVESRRSVLAACRANLSLGIALLKDPHLRFLTLLGAAPYHEPPVIARTRDGAVHEFGRVCDPEWCRAIQERLRYARLYVADGHHRYEAALRHRNETRSRGAEYLMLHLASAHDPGLRVLPSHRLIHSRRPPDPGALEDVTVRALPYAPEALAERWPGRDEVWLIRPDRAESLTPRAGHPTLDGLNDLAHRLATSAFPRSGDVTLTATPHAHVAVRQVQSGSAAAAILVPAMAPEVVTSLADRRRVLPPKSTYFWPKPMAGLVMRTLDPPEAFV